MNQLKIQSPVKSSPSPSFGSTTQQIKPASTIPMNLFGGSSSGNIQQKTFHNIPMQNQQQQQQQSNMFGNFVQQQSSNNSFTNNSNQFNAFQ